MNDEERNEMDSSILGLLGRDWRKQALIVGTVVQNQPSNRKWRDTAVSERIQALVKAEQIEAIGDLSRMGFSEIRLPQTPST